MANILISLYNCAKYAQIQKILSAGSNFERFYFLLSLHFLDDEGWKDPNTTISGPSLTRQVFKWHFAGMLMMAQH